MTPPATIPALSIHFFSWARSLLIGSRNIYKKNGTPLEHVACIELFILAADRDRPHVTLPSIAQDNH
jgi:hypothetical protein